MKNEFILGRWSSFQKEVPITTEATEEPVETAAVLDRRDKPVTQPFKADAKKSQKPKPIKKENRKTSKIGVMNPAANAGPSEFAENWFECWQANNADIIVNYSYIPSPILDWTNTSSFFNRNELIVSLSLNG